MWAHLFTGEALGEKWRWYRVTEGEREANEDHLRQRISYVGEDNRGVMRIVIDISQESCYISWEAERERRRFLRQRMGHEITREKQIPRLALPVWFIPFFFLFIAAQTFHQKRCKAVRPHIARCSLQLGIVVTRAGETWDPATSRVCKQDMAAREVCVLCKKLCSSLTLTLASCFACVWSMLISYC